MATGTGTRFMPRAPLRPSLATPSSWQWRRASRSPSTPSGRRWRCAAAWSTTTSTPPSVLTRASLLRATRMSSATCRSLDRIAARTGERWVKEWEPSLLPILHRTRTADFLAMSDDELAARAGDPATERYLLLDDSWLDQPQPCPRHRADGVLQRGNAA